jgi:hypothetical protein
MSTGTPSPDDHWARVLDFVPRKVFHSWFQDEYFVGTGSRATYYDLGTMLMLRGIYWYWVETEDKKEVAHGGCCYVDLENDELVLTGLRLYTNPKCGEVPQATPPPAAATAAAPEAAKPKNEEEPSAEVEETQAPKNTTSSSADDAKAFRRPWRSVVAKLIRHSDPSDARRDLVVLLQLYKHDDWIQKLTVEGEKDEWAKKIFGDNPSWEKCFLLDGEEIRAAGLDPKTQDEFVNEKLRHQRNGREREVVKLIRRLARYAQGIDWRKHASTKDAKPTSDKTPAMPTEVCWFTVEDEPDRTKTGPKIIGEYRTISGLPKEKPLHPSTGTITFERLDSEEALQ